MLHEIYAVYNRKAKFYERPFHAKSLGDAERHFEMAINDRTTFLNKYPEDYDLYYLGQFNDSTGQYELIDSPEHKHKALTFLKTNNQIIDELRSVYEMLHKEFGPQSRMQ